MRQMKDSGIEWIGEIPENWEITKHKYVMHKEKDICEHYNGEDIISLTMNGVIIRDLDAGGKMPTTFDGYQYVEPDKLLLCLFDIDVTPRCVGVIRNNGLTSPAYSKFSVHNGYSVEYYNYLLRAIDDDKVLVHLAKNLRSSFTETDFGALPTIAPPLHEQQTISAYLDRQCTLIDSVIEKTKASIEEYKKLRQAVITQAVTKGVRGDRAMKDSGIEWIGEIPEEWHLIKITRMLAENHPYPMGDGDHGLIKTDDYRDEGVPYLRVQNLGWGTELLLDNVVYISEEKNEQIKNSTLRPNDILFAKTGATIGKTGIIPESLPISNTTSHIGKITLSEKYHPRFVFYVLSSPIGYKQFWQIAIQKTTRPELSIEEMRGIKILVPNTYEEQEEITSYLDEKCSKIDKIITKKEQFLTELEAYKKSLIYEYVTGKKEVPQA